MYACGCTIMARCCFNRCAPGGAPAAAVAAAGEDIVKNRATAGRIENGLVSAQAAERARRRPPKEEAGAKASDPDASAATSRGLHIVAWNGL
jgi:hypothetical protein